MAADSVRMDAYERAIAATVRPGSVVLDLGAGSGIMSFLALRAGARRVHAVEPNPSVWLIPEIARESGIGDAIVVHQSSSLEMAVPEPVDVVISDLRGASPLLDDNFRALNDVRTRWLAPGGVLMPRRDELRIALVEAKEMHRRLEDGIQTFARFGLGIDAVRRSVRNQVYSDSPAPIVGSDMLSAPETWAVIDYGAAPTTTVEGTATLHVRRGGMALGVCAFFHTELAEGVSFSTEPGQMIVYGRIFLPLAEPLRVEVGDRVVTTMRADVTGDRYAWDTTFERGTQVIRSLRQASFLGDPASLAALVRSSSRAQPRLSSRGQQVRQILSALDGTRSLEAIAAEIGQERSSQERETLLELARSLAARYGE